MHIFILTVVLSFSHYGSETVTSWTQSYENQAACANSRVQVRKKAQQDGAKVVILSCEST